MAWQLTDDVDVYLAAAGDFLRVDAARNTIQLSAAQAVQSQGPAAFGGAAPGPCSNSATPRTDVSDGHVLTPSLQAGICACVRETFVEGQLTMPVFR